MLSRAEVLVSAIDIVLEAMGNWNVGHELSTVKAAAQSPSTDGYVGWGESPAIPSTAQVHKQHCESRGQRIPAVAVGPNTEFFVAWIGGGVGRPAQQVPSSSIS